MVSPTRARIFGNGKMFFRFLDFVYIFISAYGTARNTGSNIVMNIKQIDWAKEWERRSLERNPEGEPADRWNSRAQGYSRRAWGSSFTKKILPLLDFQKNQTVLDMGCGEGAVTIPLSQLVQSVIAVDYSSAMIELLKKNIKQFNRSNIYPVTGSWTDDWQTLGLKTVDRVLASRSFQVSDLRFAVEQMNQYATERIDVILLAGESRGASLARKAVGRSDPPAPDYIYLVNHLYSMDIQAEVRFLPPESGFTHRSIEEAFQWMKLGLGETTREEDERLMSFIQKHIKQREGLYGFEPDGRNAWAIVSWKPRKLQQSP